MIRYAHMTDLPFFIECWEAGWQERPIPFRTLEEMLAVQSVLFTRIVRAEQNGVVLIEPEAAIVMAAGEPPVLWDYGAFVVESHRRDGIGSMLLDCAEKWAKANGFSRIIAAPYADNEGSRKWLERAGWKPMQLVLVKEI